MTLIVMPQLWSYQSYREKKVAALKTAKYMENKNFWEGVIPSCLRLQL